MHTYKVGQMSSFEFWCRAQRKCNTWHLTEQHHFTDGRQHMAACLFVPAETSWNGQKSEWIALWSVFSTLSAVPIATWVEVWKRFTQDAFCSVGGWWSHLANVDSSSLRDESRCCFNLLARFFPLHTDFSFRPWKVKDDCRLFQVKTSPGISSSPLDLPALLVNSFYNMLVIALQYATSWI